MAQTLVGELIRVLTAVISVHRFGKETLIGHLEGLIQTVERFRAALDADDKAALIEAFHAYKMQIELLEKRSITAVSNDVDSELRWVLAHEYSHALMHFEMEEFEEMERERSKEGLKLDLSEALGTMRGIVLGLRAGTPAPEHKTPTPGAS
jgi:hypothetical protein